MSHRSKHIKRRRSFASSFFGHTISQSRHRRIRLEQLESRAMLVGDGQFPTIVHIDTPSSIEEGSDFTVKFRLNRNPASSTPVGAEVQVRIDLNNNGSFELPPQTITVAAVSDASPELAVFSYSWSDLVAAGINDGENPALPTGIYEYVIEVADIDAEVLPDEELLDVNSIFPTLLEPFTVTPAGCGSDVVLEGTLIEIPNENGLAVYIDWDFTDSEFFPSEDDVLTVGDGLTYISGNQYSINASHPYLVAGDYTVVLRATASDLLIPFEDSYQDTLNDENESLDISVTGVGGSLSATIGEPSSDSVPGQTRQFTASVTPGCGTPGTLTYDWLVTKDNVEFASSTNAAFVFTPDDTGHYVVSLNVEDDVEGAQAANVEFDVEPFILEAGNLAVGSGNGNDTITVSPGSVIVSINGVPICDLDVTGSVTVYGGAGDDTISVAPGIVFEDTLLPVPFIIYGGAGNDVIKGGSGEDVIYGGDGDDHLKGGDGADILIGDAGQDFLTGGSGRDILIGGDEADKIHGNSEDDILISGIVSFSDDIEALIEIRDVWTSANCFIVRTALIEGCSTSLTNHLNSTTVSDDNYKDILAGDQGIDWFFANLCLDSGDDADQKDKILDANLFELCFANDLDL